MKYDDEIEAGIETDTFIHLRIFDRSDEAPPYSTDQKTAEWLANHYSFAVKPLHLVKRAGPIEELEAEDLEPYGYVVFAGLTIQALDGTVSSDTYMISSAPTFPLCVARSALLLNQLVKTSWAREDANDSILAGP